MPIAPVPPSKARLAGLVKNRDSADPAIAEARAALKAANLGARIRRDVATWPPLTPEVKSELAIILLQAPDGDGDAA